MGLLETAYYIVGIIFTLLSIIKTFLDIRDRSDPSQRPLLCRICIPIWVILVIHLLARSWPFGCFLQSVLDILLAIALLGQIAGRCCRRCL